MKVLHIITSLNDGGAEAVLYRLCKHDIHNKTYVISLMGDGKYSTPLENLGVKVFTLNMSAGKIKFKNLLTLYTLIKKIEPDVVQTWMYHADFLGGIVSRLAGVKNIVWGVHNTTLEKHKSKRLTIFIAKINGILSKFVPRRIIYCAQKSKEVQEAIGFDKTKGVIVRNGYNTNDFCPNKEFFKQFRNELSLKVNDFIIGHVGRYDPNKDYPNLISSLAILKKENIKFILIMVGTNLDNSNIELKSLISRYELDNYIKLIGRRDDIPTVMNGFDIFVLSSAAEAFPNVLSEAMACGIPCISTDVGDASYIVGEDGWVVESNSPKLLAKAIQEAYIEKNQNHSQWLNKQHMVRKKIIEELSIEKMVKAYNDVWNEDKELHK